MALRQLLDEMNQAKQGPPPKEPPPEEPPRPEDIPVGEVVKAQQAQQSEAADLDKKYLEHLKKNEPREYELNMRMRQIRAESQAKQEATNAKFEAIDQKLKAGASFAQAAPELLTPEERRAGKPPEELVLPSVFMQGAPEKREDETDYQYKMRLHRFFPEVEYHLDRYTEEASRRVLQASLENTARGGELVYTKTEEAFKDLSARGLKTASRRSAIKEVKRLSDELAPYRSVIQAAMTDAKVYAAGKTGATSLGRGNATLDAARNTIGTPSYLSDVVNESIAGALFEPSIDIGSLTDKEKAMYYMAYKAFSNPKDRGVLEDFREGLGRGAEQMLQSGRFLADATVHAAMKLQTGDYIHGEVEGDPFGDYQKRERAAEIRAQVDPTGLSGNVGGTMAYMAAAATPAGIPAIMMSETPQIADEMMQAGATPEATAMLAPFAAALVAISEKAQVGTLMEGSALGNMFTKRIRSAVLGFGLKYGGEVIEQTGEEVFQEATKQAMVDVAMWASGQGKTVEQAFHDQLKRINQTIKGAGGVMAVLAGLRVPLDLNTAMAEAQAVPQSEVLQMQPTESARQSLKDILASQNELRAGKMADAMEQEGVFVEAPPQQERLQARKEYNETQRAGERAAKEEAKGKRAEAKEQARKFPRTERAERVKEAVAKEEKPPQEDIDSQLVKVGEAAVARYEAEGDTKSAEVMRIEVDKAKARISEREAKAEKPIAAEKPKQPKKPTGDTLTAGQIADDIQKRLDAAGLSKEAVDKQLEGMGVGSPIAQAVAMAENEAIKDRPKHANEFEETADATATELHPEKAPTAKQVKKHFEQNQSHRAVVHPDSGNVYLNPSNEYKPLSEATDAVDMINHTKEGHGQHEAGHLLYDRMPADVAKQWEAAHEAVGERLGEVSDSQEEFSDHFAVMTAGKQWSGKIAPEYRDFFTKNADALKPITPTVVKTRTPVAKLAEASKAEDVASKAKPTLAEANAKLDAVLDAEPTRAPIKSKAPPTLKQAKAPVKAEPAGPSIFPSKKGKTAAKRTVYRGEGKSAAEIYAGVQHPVAGEGTYYALNEKDAKNYGEKVTKSDVAVDNPLTVSNDSEWRALTKAAGWQYPNVGGSDMSNASARAKVVAQIEKLAAHIKGLGHDSLVVNVPASEANGKTLQNVFGHSQMVVYPNEGVKLIDAGKPKLSESEGSKRIADLEDEMRLGEEELANIEQQQMTPGGQESAEIAATKIVARMSEAYNELQRLRSGEEDVKIPPRKPAPKGVRKALDVKALSANAPSHLRSQLERGIPANDEAEFEKRRVEVISDIKKVLGNKYAIEAGVLNDETIGQVAKRSFLYRAMGSMQLSYESIVEDLTGGMDSKGYDVLVEGPREGRHMASRHYVDGQDLMNDARRAAGFDTDSLEKAATSQFTMTLPGGKKLGVSLDEAIAIVATARDPENVAFIQRDGITFTRGAKPLALGRGEIAALDARLKSAYPEMYAFLDHTFRDVVNGWGTRLEAEGYKVDSGKDLKVHEDYFPRIRDSRHIASEDAERLKKMDRGDEQQPELRHIRQLRKRTERHSPLLIRPYTQILAEHVHAISNYAGKAVAVRDAQRIIDNVEFRNTLSEGLAHGDKIHAQLKEAFEEYKTIDRRMRSDLEKKMNGVLRRATRAVLAQPQIYAYQLVSLETAAQEMPRRYLWNFNSSLSDANLKAHFPELYQRIKGTAHFLVSPALVPSETDAWRMFYGGKGALLDRVALGPLHAMDTAVINRIITGCIKWAEADGFKGDAMMEEARKRAMRVVDRTQPTFDPMTISALQLLGRKNVALRTAFMFSSQATKNMNMAWRAHRKFIRSEHTVKDFGIWARDLARPTIVNAAIIYAMSHGYGALVAGLTGQKRDEKEWWEHLSGVIDRTYGGWLLGRDVIFELKRIAQNQIKGGSPFTGSRPREMLLFSVISEGYSWVEAMAAAIGAKARKSRWKRGPKIGQSKFPQAMKDAVLQSIRAGSLVFGVPFGLAAERPLRPLLQKSSSR